MLSQRTLATPHRAAGASIRCFCSKAKMGGARPRHAVAAARVNASDQALAPLAFLPASQVDGLLLSYLASRNRGLFAARCFVETVLGAYREGARVEDLSVGLQLKGMQADLGLGPLDQDVMLTWMLIIMLTAKDLGVPYTPRADADADAADAAEGALEADGITRRYGREVLALLAYVKQGLALYYDQGYTLQRLTDLQAVTAQSAASGGGGPGSDSDGDGEAVDPGPGGRSQFMELMQQYSRLVVMTAEAVGASGLPVDRPLDNPRTELGAPTGYADAFARGDRDGDPSSSAPPLSSPRALAARLVTAFVAALLGSRYAARAFAAYALDAYRRGVPAGALAAALTPPEFSQAGGLVALGAPPPAGAQQINAQLFGTWLSCAYMAAAQLGAPFPGAAAAGAGWAWAGHGDAVEANALASFVANVLPRAVDDAQRQLMRQQQQQEEEEGGDSDEAASASSSASTSEQQPLPRASRPSDALLELINANPAAAAALDAERAALDAELRERGTLRGRALPPLVRVDDEQLTRTSAATALWQAQLELVAEVAAQVAAAAELQQAQQLGGGAAAERRRGPAR